MTKISIALTKSAFARALFALLYDIDAIFGYNHRAMDAVDFSRYDQTGIYTIGVSVLAAQDDTGPVKLLAHFAHHSWVPLVNRQGILLAMIHDGEFLKTPTMFPLGADIHADNDTLSLPEHATIGDARKIFEESHQPMVPIVDSKGRYTGHCASRHKLLKLLHGLLRPPRIGGLATPMGVYMTSGNHISGSGIPGLIATGVLFSILFRCLDWVFMGGLSLAIVLVPALEKTPPLTMAMAQLCLFLGLILSVVRLTPMAGLHAAEHMTINAIEHGLPIEAESVRTQPKEHMRCGTNLMVVLIGVQLLWLSMESMRSDINYMGSFVYFLIGAIFISSQWRTIGYWVQAFFTTKRPTDAELESGMKAGRELLQKYYAKPHASPGFIRRIWGAGFIQIILSYVITNQVLEWLSELIFSVI